MSVKERAKAFESQPISPLASKRPLPQRLENVSSSNDPLLDIPRITRDGDSPLSPYRGRQAVQMVQLDAGALESLSSAPLEEAPTPSPRRPSSLNRSEGEDLIIFDADELSESSTSKDAANLPQTPLPRRTQSSEAELPPSKAKRPLPVPQKSEALLQKFRAASLTKEPSRPIQRLPHSNVANTSILRSNNDDKPPITIDNDVDSNEDSLAGTDVIRDVDPHCDLIDGTKDVQDSSEQQVVVPKNFFDDVQGLIKGPLLKLPKTDESRWKISQTMDSLLIDAKHNLDQVGQMTKPVVAGAGRGLEWTRIGAKNALDNTAVPKVFMRTKDDFTDIAAKANGKDGLCSKCQELSNDIDQIQKESDGSKKDIEWATPLSRIIYHADWCRICRLLLNMLCELANDPLLHPGVAPYVQPEIKGATIKEWSRAGWKYTDSHWPFGHGDKRHVGATYVLGPGGEALKAILTMTLPAIVKYGYLAANPKQRTQSSLQMARDQTRDAMHRRELKLARARNSYPLSYVIKIAANASLLSARPGLLIVALLGYGRKLGAEL